SPFAARKGAANEPRDRPARSHHGRRRADRGGRRRPRLESKVGKEIAMKWVTRERARVDRIACPWLITRFIDKNPTFLFVPANQVMAVAVREGAIPYDVPAVAVGHGGHRCSLARLLRKHKPQDPALRMLASPFRRTRRRAGSITPLSTAVGDCSTWPTPRTTPST